MLTDLFFDHTGDYRLGEPGEPFLPEEPLPNLPLQWSDEAVVPFARWLCRPFTNSVSRVITVLECIPDSYWPTARLLFAEHILPAYWTAFQAGDKTERRRLSALRVFIEAEDKRRGFRIQ